MQTPARSYFWFWRQRNIGKGWKRIQWGGRAGLRRKNPFYAQCEWATLLERTIELTRQPVKRLHCRHGHVESYKGGLHQITNITSSNFIRVQLCKGLKFFTDKQHHKIRITFEHKLNPNQRFLLERWVTLKLSKDKTNSNGWSTEGKMSKMRQKLSAWWFACFLSLRIQRWIQGRENTEMNS